MHGGVHANHGPQNRRRGVLLVFKSLICKSQYPMASCFPDVSSSVHCLLESRFFMTVWGKQCFFFEATQFSENEIFRHKFSKLGQKTGFLGRVSFLKREYSVTNI